MPSTLYGPPWPFSWVRRVLGVDRARRVAGDDLHRRVPLLEVAADAGDRAAGPRRADEVRDPPLRLLPDLRARRPVVRLRVVRVVVLVREDRPRRLRDDRLRLLDVVLGVVGRHRGRHHDDLGAERAQQPDLLARHLVGDREDAAVALDRRGDREADAGVAARGLDDHAARLQLAPPLGALDDREADAVLDRAARVEVLGLAVERRADPAPDAAQAHERRPADHLDDVVVGLEVALHARLLRGGSRQQERGEVRALGVRQVEGGHRRVRRAQVRGEGGARRSASRGPRAAS